MTTRPTRTRTLLALLTTAALVTGLALTSAPAQAGPTRIEAGGTRAPAPPAATTTADRTAPAHGTQKARPELPPSLADGSAPRASLAAAACAPSDFGSKTGAALVTYVRTNTTTCINTLFSLSGTAVYDVFREAQMVTVANAYRDSAVSYNGTNSAGLEQLALFLHAGYYVQWGNQPTIPYGAPLENAMRAGLDAFYANSHLLDVNDAHGAILSESLILINCTVEAARYLTPLKRLLTAFNTGTYSPYRNMLGATNNVYVALFRGHNDSRLGAAVTADPSILDALYNFAANHMDLLTGDWAILDSNAGLELGRFLQYPALQPKARPLVKGLLTASAMTGPKARLWVAVAGMADFYDRPQCSYYGVCDLANRLKAAALPITHVCDPGHTIRAQSMTAAELTATCTSVRNQDAYFHNIVADPGPVADDRNTNIEIVAFDSSDDYQMYAGAIFGIDTNNGGMYLEGDPSVVGNQARFIAYEAEWMRPVFAIWNLNHEYTHYLDGRYNMYGDFGAGQVVPDIWWIEGFAEYVSYGYRGEDYSAAITEAGTHRYALSTLFQTTYANTNQTRTYNWGYLAVRYMLEKHRSDVLTILGRFRTGDYTGGYNYYNSTIGTRYDADFNTWLTACAAGACAGGGTPTNIPPTSAFDAAVTGLSVALTDRSTDSDGTISARSWNFGDGTTSTATNPTKAYTTAGTYTVTLTVTDDKGATGTSSRAVTVGSGSLPECTGSDIRTLGKNCQRTNRGATTGNYDYFYLTIPAGTAQLRITSSGGTGNCDLYYNSSSWAYTTSYTSRSTGPNNSETLTVSNPRAGTNYVSLHAVGTCSGVTVKTEF
ncbi:collagenase [Longispora urticae]